MSLKQLSVAIFVVGLLIFGSSLYGRAPSHHVISSAFQGSLTERSAAINQAIKEGRKEYSYTTHFIPGIGVINDPSSYLDSWQKNNAPVEQK